MKLTKEDEEQVVLVYNGQQEIVANRQALSKSCFYLEHLLTGPFRESRQSRIDIHLGDEFSFTTFKAIIEFASSNKFDRGYEVTHYLAMRQLAELWMYDELANILDCHLISCISLDSLVSIHTRANIFRWTNIQEACLDAERTLDASLGSFHRDWARCPLPGHEKHHYSSCKNTLLHTEEDWDREECESLTESEKDELAEIREAKGFYGLRRHFYRNRRG